MPRRRRTSYFVVAAPGHYAERDTVRSSHFTFEKALAAVGGREWLCVREGDFEMGDVWLKEYEELDSYPIVKE